MWTPRIYKLELRVLKLEIFSYMLFLSAHRSSRCSISHACVIAYVKKTPFATMAFVLYFLFLTNKEFIVLLLSVFTDVQICQNTRRAITHTRFIMAFGVCSIEFNHGTNNTMLMADTHTFWFCCCCCYCCFHWCFVALPLFCWCCSLVALLLLLLLVSCSFLYRICCLHCDYTHHWPVRATRPMLPPRVANSEVTCARIKTRAIAKFLHCYKNP